MIFYTLIVPIWQKEPITSKDTKIKEQVIFLDSPTLEFQIKKFRHIKDLRIKSRMLFEWGKSNNPYAVSIFTDLLKVVQNDNIKADILINLFAMRRIKKSGDCAIFAELMSTPNDMIRAYSAALYLDNDGTPDNVLKLIGKERNQFVINLLLSELKAMPEKCSVGQLEALLNSEFLNIRAVAAELLAMKKGDPDLIDAMHKACNDTSIEITVSVAKGLSTRKNGGEKLLAKLANNRSSMVRAYVASAQPRKEIIKIYLQLILDPDWEVRRIAAVSLGKLKNGNSVASLIKLLSDPVSEVRDAAETAIIEIAPNQTVLKEIGEKVMPSTRPRPYAITLLGTFKDLRFAPQITHYLNTTSDENIIYRSIVALDQMNYTKAEKSVRAKYNYATPRIKKAVAHALGTFAMKDSFDTIIKLTIVITDKNGKIISGTNDVANEAIISMGRIADEYFNAILTNIVCNCQAPPGLRATACWSIAKINQPTKKIVKQLQNIMLKKIIHMPDEITYDANFVRISAVLAMIDMSKKHTNLKPKILSALETLQGNNNYLQISDPQLKEYARQTALYMNGDKNIQPTQISTRSTVLTLSKIKKY